VPMGLDHNAQRSDGIRDVEFCSKFSSKQAHKEYGKTHSES